MRRSPQNVNAAGSPGGWQEITIDTRRRLAAGLCELSLAVLSSGFGEAVATADSEAGNSISDTPDPISDTADSIGGTDRPGSDSEQVVTLATEPTGDTGGTGTVRHSGHDCQSGLGACGLRVEPQPESEAGGHRKTHDGNPAGLRPAPDGLGIVSTGVFDRPAMQAARSVADRTTRATPRTVGGGPDADPNIGQFRPPAPALRGQSES